MDYQASTNKKQIELNELEEFRLHAYSNVSSYMERIKMWDVERIKAKEFCQGQKVLLFNSHLRWFPENLQLR